MAARVATAAIPMTTATAIVTGEEWLELDPWTVMVRGRDECRICPMTPVQWYEPL